MKLLSTALLVTMLGWYVEKGTFVTVQQEWMNPRVSLILLWRKQVDSSTRLKTPTIKASRQSVHFGLYTRYVGYNPLVQARAVSGYCKPSLPLWLLVAHVAIGFAYQ